jgi:4-amino-4-deoxy-L-arabinose transferase-like glycosyltransferase
MDRFLILAGIIAIALAMAFIAFPDGAAALLMVIVPSLLAIAFIRHYSDDKRYITNVFLLGLLLRLGFGIFVHVFDLRTFFGGDAITYDYKGYLLLQSWLGHIPSGDIEVRQAASMSGSGWGMNYLVAALYAITGRNIFAAQSFCAVIGAATAPLVYFCSTKIFRNKGVGRFAAVAVAVFPAFIIWSAQLLKDGLIVFLLVLAITMVLQLQERLDYAAVVLLLISLAGILSLRFYIFYMVGVAVVGSFLIGTTNSPQSIARRTAVLLVLGVGLTYFGVTRTATSDLDKYGNLQQLQNSRLDAAQSSKSGFAEDVDVSTTQGALSAVPVGFVYLMFAPFPWELSSLRQSITLPEVLVWWAMIPIMVYGLWWSIRHKLRSAFPIIIFTLMLTLAYSIFQGNVGTAYRQRTQIQVFLFMFIGVGWQIYKEKKEDKKLLRQRHFKNRL